MPRLSADVRISLKKRGGPTHRIEFVRQPVGWRYWVRRDGKYLPGCHILFRQGFCPGDGHRPGSPFPQIVGTRWKHLSHMAARSCGALHAPYNSFTPASVAADFQPMHGQFVPDFVEAGNTEVLAFQEIVARSPQ